VEEDFGGTSPKVLVRDAAGVLWRVKSGYEIRAEAFATRFVAALGYYAEPTVFMPGGKIAGVGRLTRAANFVHRDGSFANAAFERRDPDLKYLTDRDWAWNDNPFIGTRELKGLKLLVMLLSNWDNKDVRDRKLGSNTGILERRSENAVQWMYFVNDWGQTLGSWGSELKPKGWNCAAFTQQTALFVQGRAGRYVRFNFVGQHTDDFSGDITTSDVRWLMQYLSRITNRQIRSGLRASGASPEEVECFTIALRKRIKALESIAAKSK
jgi:hypothetical protein